MEEKIDFVAADENHHGAWLKTSHTPVAFNPIHAIVIDNEVTTFFPDRF